MRKPKSWFILFTLVLLAALLLPGIASAQDEGPRPTPSDDEVNAIAKNMFCPVCENTPLDVCGTTACIQWRQEIKDKLQEGWTADQIYDYFAQKFGDRVLAEPPKRGLNWLIYVLPPVAFVIGAFMLYRGFRSWQKPVEEFEQEAAQAAEEQDDEYASRLEEELNRRR